MTHGSRSPPPPFTLPRLKCRVRGRGHSVRGLRGLYLIVMETWRRHDLTDLWILLSKHQRRLTHHRPVCPSRCGQGGLPRCQRIETWSARARPSRHTPPASFAVNIKWKLHLRSVFHFENMSGWNGERKVANTLYCYYICDMARKTRTCVQRNYLKG